MERLFPQSRHLRFAVYALPSFLMTMMIVFAPVKAAAFSDAGRRDLDAAGSTIQRAPADPQIAEALSHISAAQIQHTIETLVSFHTRNTLSSMETDMPRGEGVNAAADWIESELKRYSAACEGCLEVKRDTFAQPAQTGPHARIVHPTMITNVYAVLRGTDPAQANRVILVTGHYDSRNTDVLDDHGAAPGANDDASGVAVSLECARVLSKLKFPATLVFAAVAGEEQGLDGSAHLAKLAKSEGWQIEGALNNDIVGGNTTPGDRFQDKAAVRVFSEGIPATATPEEARRLIALGYDSDSPSRELARAVTDVARTYDSAPATAIHPVLEFRTDRFLRGGDHISFNQQGFAAVRFTEWREDFNHQHQNVRVENGVQYGDLLKFVDFHYVARVARVNTATMATLAAAPPPPVNVQVVVSNLDNNTTLRWTAGQGSPAGTRYEVVWRELAASDWERFTASGIKAPDETDGQFSVTLPVSKDNVIFGVRAVDGAGHASVAVVPMPVR
jgi:hypothetical protein